MKKLLITIAVVVTFFAMSSVSASAIVNDTVKVGLRYADSAMFSANLENEEGAGYRFGIFDEQRVLQSVGETGETAISMTAAGDIYMDSNGNYSAEAPSGEYRHLGAWHIELTGYESFQSAYEGAAVYSGWPAWINGAYVVRVGHYASEGEAAAAATELGAGYAVRSSSAGVIVTVTRTANVIFEFDCGGTVNFGVEPIAWEGGEAVTWFKGYKYPGAFEYPRKGNELYVYNVVNLEDYVKGVIAFEMSTDWPLAALEAQAVCARTYACRDSRHFTTYGFDVCNTTDCQVYYGRGNGGRGPNGTTDLAVENTAGMKLYYEGDLIRNAVYCASNGGATDDIVNVWGSTNGYLVGKEDPYEAQTKLPSSYHWTTTYTAAELTDILKQKKHNIGTVKNVYVSEFTPMGNVRAITFEGSKGTKTFTGESCRTIFYSSTYGKSARSLRFTINGAVPVDQQDTAVYVNGEGKRLEALNGVSVLTSGGMTTLSGESFTVLSAEGTTTVAPGIEREQQPTQPQNGTFVLTGTGSGHNLGMSQYGAKAMAELGYTYEDILHFYYTNVTIERHIHELDPEVTEEPDLPAESGDIPIVEPVGPEFI